MATWSPELLLALLVGAAGIILLLVITHRSRRKAPQTAQDIAPTPPFGSARVAEAQSAAAPSTPPAATEATIQESYSAVAAAQADFPRPRIHDAASPGAHIDYTHALADIRPDASYAAVAIASALGIAHNSGIDAQEINETTAAAGNEQSYAAIAVAEAARQS